MHHSTGVNILRTLTQPEYEKREFGESNHKWGLKLLQILSMYAKADFSREGTLLLKLEPEYKA